MALQMVLFVIFKTTCASYAEANGSVNVSLNSMYPLTLILSIVFYLATAYTNPGFIIGDEVV